MEEQLSLAGRLAQPRVVRQKCDLDRPGHIPGLHIVFTGSPEVSNRLVHASERQDCRLGSPQSEQNRRRLAVDRPNWFGRQGPLEVVHRLLIAVDPERLLASDATVLHQLRGVRFGRFLEVVSQLAGVLLDGVTIHLLQFFGDATV